jgi:hypothetical protein
LFVSLRLLFLLAVYVTVSAVWRWRDDAQAQRHGHFLKVSDND